MATSTQTQKAVMATTKRFGDLTLMDLPSVGKATLDKLNEAGIKTFFDVFAQYYKDTENFKTWYTGIVGSLPDKYINELIELLAARKRGVDNVM